MYTVLPMVEYEYKLMLIFLYYDSRFMFEYTALQVETSSFRFIISLFLPY